MNVGIEINVDNLSGEVVNDVIPSTAKSINFI